MKNVEIIKSLFTYEPETGKIFWKASGRGRCKNKPAGALCSNGYIGICIGGKRFFAHRIAWVLYYGYWPESQIDHINFNKSDNRICNLRHATNSQNGKNLPIKKNNVSGHPGVCWDKANLKWRANIKVDYKSINLGRFLRIDDAVFARKKAEKIYFGEFARKT